MVPYFENGHELGMKFQSVKTGGAFDKFGLKPGDVLQQIDGVDVNLRNGFSSLQGKKTFHFTVIRNGVRGLLEYQVR